MVNKLRQSFCLYLLTYTSWEEKHFQTISYYATLHANKFQRCRQSIGLFKHRITASNFTRNNHDQNHRKVQVYWIYHSYCIKLLFCFSEHYTSNEGPVRIQYKCLVPIYSIYSQKWKCAASLFQKQNYYVMSPNFHILCLWAIYILTGSVCLFCFSQIGRQILGIY